jgi:copper transport protein
VRTHRLQTGLRTLRAIAALVLGLLAVLVFPAAPASAHATLVSSSPPANALLSSLPDQVVLTFSETVRPVTGKVRVIAPDNTLASAGDPVVDGHDVKISLKTSTPNGTYLVSYRVISADSHPVSGAYTFSVGAPTTPPSDANVVVGANLAVTATLPFVRWIGYVGLLLLVGTVLMLTVLWPNRLDRTVPMRLVLIGAGLVALATVGEMLLEIPWVAGGFSQIRSTDVQEALGSQYGAAHVIRLGVLVASLFLLRPVLRGRAWGADRVLLAVLGVIGLATWSVSGHPSATSISTISVVADMAHIGSMSVWVGGLVVLIAFLLPKANARELGVIVPVWSRWAFAAVCTLVITGVVQALFEVGLSVKALFTTEYGLLVVAKAVLVSGVVGVAFFSRRMVPKIAEAGAVSDDDVAAPLARRLRRLVIIEACVAAVVIGVTSVLVEVTPARNAVAAATEPPGLRETTLNTKLYTLQVDLEPATVGPNNEIHLYAFTPDGQPLNVKEWTATAALPSQGIEPITINLLALLPNHTTGQVTLPAAGQWTFSFTLRTTDIDEATSTWQVKVD